MINVPGRDCFYNSRALLVLVGAMLVLRSLAMLVLCVTAAQVAAAQPYNYVRTDEAPNYLVWLPEGYQDSGQAFPLLLFLHGVGEKGSGSEEAMEKVAAHGPFRSMREGNWDSSLPMIVAGPQIGGLMPWWPRKKIAASLEHLMQTYRIDPKRVYLTGVSMGGRAVWGFTEQTPGKIAAIVPAGGWADNLKDDCETFNDLGVWAFHGEEDSLIKFKNGLKPVQTISACQPPPQHPPALTKLEDAGHGNWELVYDSRHDGTHIGANGAEYANIYRWLLTFSRN